GGQGHRRLAVVRHARARAASRRPLYHRRPRARRRDGRGGPASGRGPDAQGRGQPVTTLLVVAGLDPSGGAGLLADCRVAAEHGLRAVGVITATTVQDTLGVRAVEAVAPEVVGEALTVLLGDVEVDAVKIGMLGDARTAEVVARALAATRAPPGRDPVGMP